MRLVEGWVIDSHEQTSRMVDMFSALTVARLLRVQTQVKLWNLISQLVSLTIFATAHLLSKIPKTKQTCGWGMSDTLGRQWDCKNMEQQPQNTVQPFLEILNIHLTNNPTISSQLWVFSKRNEMPIKHLIWTRYSTGTFNVLAFAALINRPCGQWNCDREPGRLMQMDTLGKAPNTNVY